MYLKSTSNFGPPLMNFMFFLRKNFLMGGGDQAEEPRLPFRPPSPPAQVTVSRGLAWTGPGQGAQGPQWI